MRRGNTPHCRFKAILVLSLSVSANTGGLGRLRDRRDAMSPCLVSTKMASTESLLAATENMEKLMIPQEGLIKKSEFYPIQQQSCKFPRRCDRAMTRQVDAGEGNFFCFLHDSTTPFGCWPSGEPKALSDRKIQWQTPQRASMHRHTVELPQKHLQPMMNTKTDKHSSLSIHVRSHHTREHKKLQLKSYVFNRLNYICFKNTPSFQNFQYCY